MEISKSTPYVRYRENISSSLHKGTVHIESEYLDRERKTTIESIEGQTWQNLAVNENKELEMLGVGSIGLSGDIYDTGEKRLAVDVVMGNATPTVNEDGTYTYSVSTMEGEYARTFDGVNHITSTSDGLDGEFHIKYNTQGEEIIGNFSTDGEESHTIENSKNGEVTSAILKGSTKYRDIDTGEFLETFEEGRNLELVSVKMPVLTTSNVIQSVKFEKLKPNLSNGSLTPNESENSSSGCDEYFDISKLSNAKFVFKSTQPFTRENYFTFLFYDKDKTYIKWLNGQMTKIADGLYTSTIPTVENANYLRVIKYDSDSQMSNIVKNSISAFVDNSLSIDSTFSIKSNILTVNEDVTLRSNGDICDELNLLTGQLTQRIDEDGEVLSQNIVKTVDLTIKDQDGKTSRQLSTYEGATHVNVSSNGLTPSADISYKMYSTTDVISGTSVTIEDGKASDMVEGVVYGESLVNRVIGGNISEELMDAIETIEGASGSVKAYPLGITQNKTVNDLIIEGSTLYNHFNFNSPTTLGGSTSYSVNGTKLTVTGSWYVIYKLNLKNNTAYTVILDNVTDGKILLLSDYTDSNSTLYSKGSRSFKDYAGTKTVLTFKSSSSNADKNGLLLYVGEYDNIMVLEGDWTDKSVPSYFNKIQSTINPTIKAQKHFSRVVPWQRGGLSTSNGSLLFNDYELGNSVYSDFIKVAKNTNYSIDRTVHWLEYDKDKKFIKYVGVVQANTPTETGATTEYLRFYRGNSNYSNSQLVGSVSGNEYNLLSCNVTLNGINNGQRIAKDTLNINTGEVTRKIAKLVLDGSDDEKFGSNWSNHGCAYPFTGGFGMFKYSGTNPRVTVVADVPFYETHGGNEFPEDGIGWAPYGDNDGNSTVILLLGTGLTGGMNNVAGARAYLQQHPVTIYYEQVTPTTEKVDVIIKDQSNNPQKALATYAPSTVLYTDSDGLVPSLSYSYNIGTKLQTPSVVANRQYSICYNNSATLNANPLTFTLGETSIIASDENTKNNVTVITPTSYSDSLQITGSGNTISNVMMLEGDYRDKVVPSHFEGIGSVENPLVVVGGKNLLNPEMLMLGSSLDGTNTQGNYRHSIFIPIEPDTKYCFRYMDFIHWYDNAKNQIGNRSQGWGAEYRIYTSPSNAKYVRVIINNANFPNEHKSQPSWFLCSIIKSDVNIYEPYYGAHLSTTPQITLHGIGDVKDEWDMVNETVTRRVGMKILNGSENWVYRSGFNSNPEYFGVHIVDQSDFGNSNGYIVDKLPYLGKINSPEDEMGDREGFARWGGSNHIYMTVKRSRLTEQTINGFKQWLSQNPITVYYQLLTSPTTESVLITPQNPKTSTASITIDEPLNAQDAIHDKLRWNPYKGCYVRYNHIVDGVAYNQHRTIENLYDLDERQCVDLYKHRTYFLPTNGSMESRTHGTSVYCLAEQGKQYCVRWDWIEAPTVDTIKVDLCGNTKIVPSTETSVVIDATHVQHSFVQLQGNGLQGKFTNLMVIETVDGEIPDVDFFSGVKAIGNTVQIDGVTKVQIDVEQTNGNLFDADLEIQSNGNVVRTINNALQSIRPNKKYVMKQHNLNLNKTNNTYLLTRDGEATRTLGLVPERAPEGLVFTTAYSEEKYRILINASINGSANVHYPIELCYADMVKDGIRPRYHDMKSFIIPMKLCRVGEVYDNLYYDDLKGCYRIQQSIGHKYFTGDASERWEMGVINLNSRTVAFTYKNGDINQLAMGDTICNGFKRLKDVNQDTEGFIIYNGDFVLRIDKERIEGNCSIDGLRAYLTSYPIHLFYQLKTPQMVDLPQYPNRLELNTYRDEVFTFIKDSNPTKFTLSIPMDRTYRFDDHQEGQGLANRVSITDERISSENVVAIQEIRGKGIANLIEDPNNVPVTPLPNYSGVATSHQLTNTKPSIVHVHGFEPSGDTKIGTWNTTDKKYQIKVMSGNSNYSLSDYYVLDVPYQLETYPDGTKDRVYYNVERQEWQVNGSYDRTIAFNASTGAFTEAVEIFRGMTPRSGMIAEFKIRFTSGTTTARLYYSVNGSTYSYVTLRGMVDDQDYYLAFFNTGGTKIDYSTKVGATTEYASMTALSATIPEGLFINQIQSLTECTHYVDKFYQYPTLHTPIELDTFDGTTNIYIDGKTTDTNIIINNDCFQKVVNTYEDVEYTVYWKYLSGDGKLTITLGGTKVEVDGTKEYATIRTQLQAPQELVYIGGYNLSIQDVMVVKGARIDELAYFEGSRQVGTLVVDEHGNKQYKITLVQGGSVLEQKDYDKVEFKDDNKHNVVVHKIVGVRPTKVD